ncbi:MAG: hypothetical protein KJN66_03970 [Bacteroidia bacterium]|nr:hypothetical protein [Bacteroidia bacterium]
MKKILKLLLLLIVLYFLLLIPFPDNQVEIQNPSQNPFIWGQDKLWVQLEISFKNAREIQDEELDSIVKLMIIETDSLFNEKADKLLKPEDPFYGSIEERFFKIAPLIAAQKNKSEWHIHFYNKVRKKLKSDSRNWDMNNPQVRQLVYRLLYGMRATVEEILLQSSDDDFVSTMFVSNEPSVVPFVDVLGIKVHSGDLLVSRGGAEVSAFISRGNDYPGNFSHVAIIHIDEQTKEPYFVEAHIEKGVAIATLEDYLKDKKLRFMVMRPRADLPKMIKNPMLPYEASTYIFNESQTRHIPYDFKMDYYDSSAMFCSEVGSYAYKQKGIDLWEFESTISSNGIINWLHVFGVENFVTQMPSDLEYDPMLSVVAEWRNKEVLFQDHLDNAVMDALISRANEGENLDYNIWLLPIARTIKAYSFILSLVGKEGVIPEGMDAETALKNNDFVDRFNKLKTSTESKIISFKEENNYLPPYWQMVRMAEESYSN